MSTARTILYNLGVFLLALVLAAIIWAAAILNNDPIETRLWQIDINTTNLPSDAQLLNRPAYNWLNYHSRASLCPG